MPCRSPLVHGTSPVLPWHGRFAKPRRAGGCRPTIGWTVIPDTKGLAATPRGSRMGPCPNHLCEDCHACPSPLASASPYPASGLPGPIRCRHRPGLATLPTHRPPSAPPLSRPTPRSRPFLSARSRPTRPRPPLLCSRFGLAATTSDLGGRLYPSTLGRQPSRHRPAQRTYPATLVSPPATTPSPGPAPTRNGRGPSDRAPRYLADGRQ